MKRPILEFNLSPSPPTPIAIPAKPHRNRAVTIADVFQWFRDSGDPRAGGKSEDARLERERIRAKFVAFCGHFKVEEARPFHIAEFVAGWQGARSNWTKKRIATTIQRPFSVAARLGFIERTPFGGLAYEQGDCGRDWTPEEFRGLLRASPPEFRRLICWIYFSGMRPGEASDMEWRDIDYKTEAIKLPAEKTKMKRDRWIPINRIMAKMLNWCSRHAEDEPRRANWVPRHERSLTHVLLSSTGCSWKLRGWVEAFRTAREKAGLSDDLVLHGARHTFATRALMAGVDVATLAEILGHKDIATTQRYLHLTGKARFLHGAMDQAISGATPRTGHLARLTQKGGAK